MNLNDSVAIVTGAGRGIGEATALRMAEYGAKVAIVDMDALTAHTVADKIEGMGRRAIAVVADVSDASDIRKIVEATLKEFKRIDILVNNAGIAGKSAKLWELTEEDWDSAMDVDLKSVFLCCKAVVPHMIERKYGKIVNVASIAGKEGNPNLTAYSTAKAGVICLTKALAKEVIDYNINVNCVSPALVDTPLLRQFPQHVIDYMVGKIPLGRLGTADEVAAVIHFLSCDDASFVTGQCYDVSGGRATY